MSFDDFLYDDKAQYSVVRALTIIGEAAKKVPKSLQSRHAEVLWRLMAGMRDIVIHEYFMVDVKRVSPKTQRTGALKG
jgi:uncharacterized protein with HEPN domain